MHWVFVAKYRRRLLGAREIDVLCSVFAEVCSDPRATLVEMDGEDPVQLRSASSANTWSNRKRRTDTHDSFPVGAILPAT
jgi:hypothetical protein